jgi:hypothetical protein
MATNKKAPSAANARGQKKSTSKRYDFSELNAITQGGKRVTIAIAADLREHAPAVLRKLTTNRDALRAIDLAEAIKASYLVFGGRLMHEAAGCIAIPIPNDTHAADQLPLAAAMVNTRLSEISDTTLWTPLLNPADRARIAHILNIREGAV